MGEPEARIIQMPHLYNIFEMPKVRAMRATTTLRSRVSIGEVLKRVPHIRKIRRADKDIAKFQLRRGAYLLLFPSGYIEVHASDEDGVREVLIAFRDELFKSGLVK